MKITGIDCHILVVPDLREDATSSSQDDLVVVVHTDEGISGVGETDTGPWLARAAIEAPGSHSMAMSMKDLLMGMDPFDTAAIWEKLYTYTAMSGRRGAVICAIGAIDMALWDIKGKALGLPVYKLLGAILSPTHPCSPTERRLANTGNPWWPGRDEPRNTDSRQARWSVRWAGHTAIPACRARMKT